jgi:hypothetical protein
MTDNNLTTENKKSYRQIVLMVYLAIAMLFTVYGTFFGEDHHRGFFFNFGKSLVWPFLLFPVVGKLVGAILLVIFIVLLLAL